MKHVSRYYLNESFVKLDGGGDGYRRAGSQDMVASPNGPSGIYHLGRAEREGALEFFLIILNEKACSGVGLFVDLTMKFLIEGGLMSE